MSYTTKYGLVYNNNSGDMGEWALVSTLLYKGIILDEEQFNNENWLRPVYTNYLYDVRYELHRLLTDTLRFWNNKSLIYQVGCNVINATTDFEELLNGEDVIVLNNEAMGTFIKLNWREKKFKVWDLEFPIPWLAPTTIDFEDEFRSKYVWSERGVYDSTTMELHNSEQLCYFANFFEDKNVCNNDDAFAQFIFDKLCIIENDVSGKYWHQINSRRFILNGISALNLTTESEIRQFIKEYNR